MSYLRILSQVVLDKVLRIWINVLPQDIEPGSPRQSLEIGSMSYLRILSQVVLDKVLRIWINILPQDIEPGSP